MTFSKSNYVSRAWVQHHCWSSSRANQIGVQEIIKGRKMFPNVIIRCLLCPIFSARAVNFLRGSIMGFLTPFVKNDEIRPSLSYKFILEQREQRSQLNSWKEQLVICSVAFWKQKCENLKNVPLTFFKFKSIPTYCLWPEALIGNFIALEW